MSHIAHGKEVPSGACWIIAPSQLLLHDWAGMEGTSKLAPVLSTSVGPKGGSFSQPGHPVKITGPHGLTSLIGSGPSQLVVGFSIAPPMDSAV
jgi:hypothetical protein